MQEVVGSSPTATTKTCKYQIAPASRKIRLDAGWNTVRLAPSAQVSNASGCCLLCRACRRLIHAKNLVCLHVVKYLMDAARPVNLDRLRHRLWSEPKMGALVA